MTTLRKFKRVNFYPRYAAALRAVNRKYKALLKEICTLLRKKLKVPGKNRLVFNEFHPDTPVGSMVEKKLLELERWLDKLRRL